MTVFSCGHTPWFRTIKGCRDEILAESKHQLAVERVEFIEINSDSEDEGPKAPFGYKNTAVFSSVHRPVRIRAWSCARCVTTKSSRPRLDMFPRPTFLSSPSLSRHTVAGNTYLFMRIRIMVDVLPKYTYVKLQAGISVET
ncbi:hypothetical protein BDQ12DRAFT_325786 [Crucibulum laeve]|uniref:Uncharacterized protein n=1 Tax=Crucibulum laeve TaxID=68775 RepID=A0A5C3LR24_9AGAR|nr:hypothetical protein BDQ12DRAFT_325786 [Crucibulum laeve]